MPVASSTQPQNKTNFIAHLPELRDKLMESMSKANPLRLVIEKSLDQHTSLPKSAMEVLSIINAGSVALGGLAQNFLINYFKILLTL